jgi:hypothetical protein
MIKRYVTGFDENGWFTKEDPKGAWVNVDDVLAAIQTLIDQLSNNHEWRNGAVLAYNAISATRTETIGEGTGPVPEGMELDGEKWTAPSDGTDHG